MGKDKLRRFAENLTFKNMVQPEFDEVFGRDFRLKGRWHEEFFGNDHPIVLELGCGRGEYTVALAARHPECNFIGIDIKGARMWRGAKTATEMELGNVGFLRTRIEFIASFFGPGEVSEIWITFPDPQLKANRIKKRLTAPDFLALYAGFLMPGGSIHLKTDSQRLHAYTKEVIRQNGLPCSVCSDDIDRDGLVDENLSIQTAYERKFRAVGLPITYLRFELGSCRTFQVEYDESELPAEIR